MKLVSIGTISVVKKPSVLQKGEQQKEKEGSQGCSGGSRREMWHNQTIATERKERGGAKSNHGFNRQAEGDGGRRTVGKGREEGR